MKQIIASGGGGFTMEPSNPLYDYYVLAQANKKDPKVCFLPTASGDSHSYIDSFKHYFEQYPCEPSVCKLIQPEVDDIEDFLLSQDIIYVGGGNTKSQLGLWKEWGVDKILRKAYDQGILLSGISAGSVCWFEQCISDCYPDRLSILPGLGFLKGSNLVHYGSEKKKAFHESLLIEEILPGFGVNNGSALHYIDDELVRVVSSNRFSKAFYTEKDGDQIKETAISPLFLGSRENFEKLIHSSKTFAE